MAFLFLNTGFRGNLLRVVNNFLKKGVKPDGKTNIVGNDPSDTSRVINETFVLDWLNHIDQSAGKGKVNFFELDNEPGLWDSVHRYFFSRPVFIFYFYFTLLYLSYFMLSYLVLFYFSEMCTLIHLHMMNYGTGQCNMQVR